MWLARQQQFFSESGAAWGGSTEAGVLCFTSSGDVYELHYSVVYKGVYMPRMWCASAFEMNLLPLTVWWINPCQRIVYSPLSNSYCQDWHGRRWRMLRNSWNCRWYLQIGFYASYGLVGSILLLKLLLNRENRLQKKALATHIFVLGRGNVDIVEDIPL